MLAWGRRRRDAALRKGIATSRRRQRTSPSERDRPGPIVRTGRWIVGGLLGLSVDGSWEKRLVRVSFERRLATSLPTYNIDGGEGGEDEANRQPDCAGGRIGLTNWGIGEMIFDF